MTPRRTRSKRLVTLPMIILGIYTGMSASLPVAWACPMCSENLPTGVESSTPSDGETVETEVSLAAGFYYSILLMLAVPFTLMLSLGGAMYFHSRKAAAAGLSGVPQ